MSRSKSWVLTDVAADIWLDAFRISSDDFPTPPAHAGGSPQAGGSGWSISKRTLRGGRRDGVDLIEVNNGALSFSVLPTRGMGVWRGQYRGLHLGWRGLVQGPVHPKHVNLLDRGGLGWLDGFDEWICRCGLSSNGPPGYDPPLSASGKPEGSQFLTLHGRIANLPAHFVEVQVHLEPPYELSIIGQVDEATLFFSNLRLTTTITTTPGSNRLFIQDVVENLSGKEAELELLYHCQVGPPFLEAGSRIRAPIEAVRPRNAHAASAMDRYETCEAPTRGFAEQVYFYELAADATGHTLALLHNATVDRGVVLRMNRAELPRFIVWKNTASMEDGYVTGLEPATNYPNFKSFEREKGRVAVLPPGGRYSAAITIEVHDSSAGVRQVIKEIETLQARTTAILHKTPQADYCQ